MCIILNSTKHLLKDDDYSKKLEEKEYSEQKKLNKLLNTISKTKAELRERREELPVN